MERLDRGIMQYYSVISQKKGEAHIQTVRMDCHKSEQILMWRISFLFSLTTLCLVRQLVVVLLADFNG